MAEKEEKMVEKAEVRDGQNGEIGPELVVGAAEAEQAEAKDESGGGADAASEAAGDELTEAEAEAELKEEEAGLKAEADGEAGAMVSGVEIERLIAEAEARGYERGRHEGIEAWMREGVAERWDGRRVIGDDVGDSEVMILNNMRRSVWE
ncbi:MAG: hypothetical protein PUD39_00875 [Bacteroidales bacterium]|nr:hypothetical protein [Bacteroidales bacterium]